MQRTTQEELKDLTTCEGIKLVNERFQKYLATKPTLTNYLANKKVGLPRIKDEYIRMYFHGASKAIHDRIQGMYLLPYELNRIDQYFPLDAIKHRLTDEDLLVMLHHITAIQYGYKGFELFRRLVYCYIHHVYYWEKDVKESNPLKWQPIV